MNLPTKLTVLRLILSLVIIVLLCFPFTLIGLDFGDIPVGAILFETEYIIAGVILLILGILANILHVKFSQGFGYTPIHWTDIKPNIDNTVLGAVCGTFGFAFIGASALIGLCAGVYWFIITL